MKAFFLLSSFFGFGFFFLFEDKDALRMLIHTQQYLQELRKNELLQYHLINQKKKVQLYQRLNITSVTTFELL